MIFNSLYKKAALEVLELTTGGQLNSKYSNKPTLLAIIDGSEIRKEYSQEMEDLQKVLGLNKELINGYRSVGAILTTEDISLNNYNKPKTWLLEQTTFSKHEKNYKTDKLYSLKAIQRVNTEIKTNPKNKDLQIIYLLDRLYDDQDYLHQLDKKLKAKFVVRVSHLNRKVYQESPVYSNLPNLTNEQKESLETQVVETKLSQTKFDLACFTQELDYLKIKNKTFFNVTIYYKASQLLVPVFQDLSDTEELVSVIYLQVNLTHRITKSKGKSITQNIYKNPIGLYSNLEVEKLLELAKPENKNQLQELLIRIHKLYLKRWRIESVFRFLKTSLGLERFQIQHLKEIKNLISLTYLAGSYFYATDQERIDDPPLIKELELMSRIGYGKGVVSATYISRGINKLAVYYQINSWIDEGKVTREELDQARKRFGIDQMLRNSRF